MIGIYFSGTGNSKYALELFLDNYNKAARAFPLEDKNIIHYIKENKEIVFSYSVQFSSLPKMLKDFIDHNKHLWRGKKRGRGHGNGDYKVYCRRHGRQHSCGKRAAGRQ